jgi:hypothetical protein
VTALMPQTIDAGVELGNAWLRLGDGAHAIAAYRRLLEQTKTPLDPAFAQQLRAQIARIETGEDPSRLQPLRDPWLEQRDAPVASCRCGPSLHGTAWKTR